MMNNILADRQLPTSTYKPNIENLDELARCAPAITLRIVDILCIKIYKRYLKCNLGDGEGRARERGGGGGRDR